MANTPASHAQGHVPPLQFLRREMDDVLNRLTPALGPAGVILLSFTYGDKEEAKDGWFFNYYDEALFSRLVQIYPSLSPIKSRVSIRGPVFA